MLEQILQRIAVKGEATLPQKRAEGLELALLRATHGQQSGYPAAVNSSHPLKSKVSANPVECTQSSAAWTRDKLAYQRACSKGIITPFVVDCFANYGPTHNAVAAWLWANRHCKDVGVISIYNHHGVVALLLPQERQVLLRKALDPAQLTHLHHAVAPTYKGRLPAAGQDFETTSIDMLLWFYGQTCPAATDLLSRKFIEQPLHLRKLPTVEAKALELRHLNLIQYFSAGAFYFESLQRAVPAQQARWLCADLASLYLVGALATTPHLATKRD